LETVGAVGVPETMLRFACPSCGRKFSTKARMAGRKVRCNGCGAGVRVPEGGWSAVAQPLLSSSETPAAPAPADSGGAVGSSSLLEDLASLEGVRRRKSVDVGAVLPSRAEVMERVRQEVAGREALEAQRREEKARARARVERKKRSGDFDPKDTLTLVGGVSALVAALAFLAWGYPGLRFPLGGLLCLIGFVVYILGAASLRQLAAEEGPLRALLYRFCPPYQWYFVATHWADAKDHFAFFAAGFVILSIGGAVIKTSEVGRKAEASERAYQKLRRGDRSGVPPVVPPRLADDGR
jgi:hypothetical protein